MGSSHISIKEVKLDHFGEIEGVLFAKVPIVPIADLPPMTVRYVPLAMVVNNKS